MTANSPEPGRPAGPLPERIRPLSALGRGDADRFGAKAATLGHLSARGFTVPDGFAIPADAFGLGSDGPINAALADAICAAYRRLGEGSVAVRSSAFDEDVPQASAAGIYESVLGVGDEAALIAAVRHCLASAAAAPALAHRTAQGRGTAAGSMGVLVQRMVLADVAGVAYTVDPITARRDRLCLNATRGLGEALAAGRVSGETQVTDRAGTLIRGDRLPGAIPVLTPGQARALAALADRLETELGGPLDIEFAFAGTTLYCLQARPIAATGLAEAQDARRAQVYLAAERVRLQERLRGLRTRGVMAQLRDLAPELVFHLHLEELNRPPDLALLESRRTERRLGRRLLREGRLPAVIQEGAIQTLGAAGRQAPGRQLRGRAMAPGCSVGRVRVLDLDLDDPESLLVHLTGNEVLVTRSANLGLASLLRIAAGLVVEVGGVLAHAACQARESGIPAVVLDNATSLLKDGMTVRLDGARGRVSIVAY